MKTFDERGFLCLQARCSGVTSGDAILDMPSRRGVFFKKTGPEERGRTRIAFKPAIRNELNRLRQNRLVRPQDRERFISDPRAYLQPAESFQDDLDWK